MKTKRMIVLLLVFVFSLSFVCAAEETYNYDGRFGGDPDHLVVMQNVTADITDNAIEDIAATQQEDNHQEDDVSRIGIISAMDNEIRLLLENAEIDHVETIGDIDYHVGTLCGQDVVITRSGIGKILAASGVTTLLNNFHISRVLFTGIAGGVGDETQVMDMVIATDLVQHDYGQMTNDGFEWFEGYEADGYYPCDEELVNEAYEAAVSVVGQEHVYIGTIATGDQFIASEEYVNYLQDHFDAIACEMEGAAIALVCTKFDIPFVIIRSMSDKADGLAHETYENMADTAADNSSRIILKMLENMGAEETETEKTEASEGSETDIVETIRECGILKVGTAGDYQPMSYLDPETGTYVGFDAELAQDLAASLGVEIEYVETSWPTLMEDTLAGKFDLAICGITITEARQEQALMSNGYLGNGKTVLCREEDADKYTSLEAINRPEVRVMENPGGLNEKFARENLPDATLIIHEINQEIPGLVASGEADVMITETMEAGYYVGQDSRLAAPLIYEPFTQGQLGILMPKGSENLLAYVNTFLEEEKESGRIEQLAEEYIYRYITEEMDEAA